MTIRRACRTDIPSIISIYSRDPLTGGSELASDPLPDFYYSAFDQIASDPNQLLLVAEEKSTVIGSLQMTVIQHLIFRAFRRAVLEAIFVHPNHHGKGAGTALIQHAVRAAREAHCTALELTSNKAREKAHAFYSKLGFVATHQGFKLTLQSE